MTQDVTVETTADADNDVTVEEVENQEPEQKDEVEDESQETESQEEGDGEEEPKTVEEKLAALEKRLEEKEREAEAKQKKIDRQTAAYNAAQKALEKERQERQAALEKVNATVNDEPKIDDFDTFDDYQEALSDWKADKKVQAKELEYRQRQEQEKFQALAAERAKIAIEQETEYLKVNPRYKASKSEFESFVSTAQVDPAVENAIVSMAYKGNVPQLIDYFGSNNGERIEELETISRMSPVEAAVEIYKIQQKLVAPKKEEKKPLPKPVKAAPASKSSKTLNADSDVLKSLGLK